MPPRQRRSTGVATSAGVRLIDIQLLSAFIAENFVCKECAQCPQLPGGACKAVPAPATGEAGPATHVHHDGQAHTQHALSAGEMSSEIS